MNHRNVLFVSLFLFLVLVLMNCSGSKGTVVVDNPQYQNDKKFIRAAEFDQGSTKTLASKNVRHTATISLAQKIKSTISSTRTEQILQDIGGDKIMDYRRIIEVSANRIEQLSVPEINDVTQIYKQQDDGSWECFLVIESPRDAIKGAILNDLIKQNEIKSEEDIKAFRAIFDKIFEY